MKRKALTAAIIRSLKKPGLYGDAHVPTLYLRVAPGRSRQFVQRLVVKGRRRDLGLGGFPFVTLGQAREQAIENKRLARAGEDPLAAKHQTKAVPTFSHALEEVIGLHEPTWKDGGRTAKSWRSCLQVYAFPKIGNRPVSDITANDLLSIVGPLWNEKHETARKLKRRISAVLDWAVLKGYRVDNPANAIKVALPKGDSLKTHFKAIPHDQVAQAIATVRQSNASPSTIAAFEFMVLTATRSGETRLATWSEFDLVKRVWEIPGERTKTGRPHKVPLSTRCIQLLKEARKTTTGEFVFPNTKGTPLSDSTVSKVVRENGIQGVPHAIARACFRSWCADSNIPREVAEASLAHVVKGVEGAYQRSDLFARRKQVMQAWSDYLGGVRGQVIALRG